MLNLNIEAVKKEQLQMCNSFAGHLHIGCPVHFADV
jgi:hypothetical protein